MNFSLNKKKFLTKPFVKLGVTILVAVFSMQIGSGQCTYTKHLYEDYYADLLISHSGHCASSVYKKSNTWSFCSITHSSSCYEIGLIRFDGTVDYSLDLFRFKLKTVEKCQFPGGFNPRRTKSFQFQEQRKC